MKNVIFIMSLIGLLMFFSCSKDTIEESSNEVSETENSQIQVIPEDSGKNLFFEIEPGLYGAKNVNALENVSYGYVAHANALAEIPVGKRRYRIHFQVKNPSKPEVEWDHQATFEIPSANVTVAFPRFGNNSYAQWRIIYTMYHEDLSNWGYSFKKKIRVKN